MAPLKLASSKGKEFSHKGVLCGGLHFDHLHTFTRCMRDFPHILYLEKERVSVTSLGCLVPTQKKRIFLTYL